MDSITELESVGLALGRAMAAAAGVPTEDACHRCATGRAERNTDLCPECWAVVSAEAIDRLPYVADVEVF